jgi:hypothetical protein
MGMRRCLDSSDLVDPMRKIALELGLMLMVGIGLGSALYLPFLDCEKQT